MTVSFGGGRGRPVEIPGATASWADGSTRAPTPRDAGAFLSSSAPASHHLHRRFLHRRFSPGGERPAAPAGNPHPADALAAPILVGARRAITRPALAAGESDVVVVELKNPAARSDKCCRPGCVFPACGDWTGRCAAHRDLFLDLHSDARREDFE